MLDQRLVHLAIFHLQNISTKCRVWQVRPACVRSFGGRHTSDRARHRTLNAGGGQNLEFGRINVELNGKQFERVTWPLIRGLFVLKSITIAIS